MGSIHQIRFVAGAALLALMASTGFATAETAPKVKPWLEVGGSYAFNGYSQNNFFLGRLGETNSVGAPGLSDRDVYSIQIVRFDLAVGVGDYAKMVVRGDVAQGIWGTDNNRREPARGGFSNLFNRKDTNFLVHFDRAYVDVTEPNTKINAKLGRQHWVAGNRLVLDQDNDGLMLTLPMGEDARIRLGYSKMSEGADALSDEDAIGPGGLSTRDAEVFVFDYGRQMGAWNVVPYFLYYQDRGDVDGSAYQPNEIQYLRPRFTPQLSWAGATGFSFTSVLGKVTLKGEFDYLWGKDFIENTSSGALQVNDVNNGTLTGYNLYLDAKMTTGKGRVGAVFGLGSGDDDPMSGNGNINKIRTNGYFYVTEVWEDSVMPDEGGITPQGLGSPASRGYREFENSILAQLNFSWPLHTKLDFYTSVTGIWASQEVRPWRAAAAADTTGLGNVTPDAFYASAPAGSGSKDLGYEVDGKLTWKILPSVKWIFRGGAFVPGDGTAFLINGSDQWTDTVWELRTTFVFKLDKVRIGG